MPQHLRGILALLVVTLVWGTTFPAMKDLTTHFSPAWIIFIRFALAALLLAPFLWRGARTDIAAGLVLGTVLFGCFVFQVEGLALTSSNRNAFITGLNVLVVPLIGIALGALPDRRIVLALVLAVAGLAALCWDGGAWGRGDTLALMGAFAFGAYVKLMEVRTRTAVRLLTITATQVLVVALWAAVWLATHGGFDGAVAALGGGLARHWYSLAYLGAVCTAAIIALQTWGQRHASANEAAVIYAFEPAAAALFGFMWLGETMGIRGWAGAALLISGMIASQWNSPGRPAARLAPE